MLFIQLITIKNERIYMQITRIAYICEYKKRAIIFDIDGQEFDLNETYDEFIVRFNNTFITSIN